MVARRSALALLVSFTVLVGACSSNDDGDDTTASGDTQLDDQDLGVVSQNDPVAGGSLVYAIGAETDGWNPTTNAWGPEGVQVAKTVYDPLAAYDADGVVQPFLAESIEPNDDYTEWTITLREGVTFHNGDAFTAEAVKVSLEGHRDSALSGPTVRGLDEVDVVDDLTAVVHMNSPWVSFPAILTAQVGVVPHPSIIQDNINDEPIGTGPFQFVEWVPDNRFVAERYDDYWRPDLPYLESIEYRPLVDFEARRQAFDAGDIDIFMGAAPQDIETYAEEADASDDLQYFADRGENEEGFVQLNLEAPPFDDLRVRQALAYATDEVTYNTVIDNGVFRIANGPFVPESPYYVDTDFPRYDPDKAQALIAEVEADTGGPIAFTLANTPDDVGRAQSALLQEMWQDAGFEVELAFTQQAQLIFDVLAGDYQAVAWRQFGSPDPDGDSEWWYSDSTLNFARVRDPEIDAALDLGRSSDDPDTRKEAYATLQERFTALVPYIWLAHVEFAIVAKPYVQGVGQATLPDGEPAKPFLAGTQRVEQLWIDDSLR